MSGSVLHAVDRRSAPREPGRVERQPDALGRGVGDVAAQPHQGVLALDRGAGEIVVIGGEEPGAGVGLERETSDRLVDADLRLERPAVVPEVDELVGVVVSPRGSDGEVRGQHPPLGGDLQLVEGERRRFNKSKAASLLGITLSQLSARLRRHGVD